MCQGIDIRDEVHEERILHLRFLDELSGTVQTRREFKGIKDGPLEVALYDATGNRVTTGPESSAEVEIVLIDASGDNKEKDMANEKFERRIIRARDEKKPHFVNNVYVNLDKGGVKLTDLMLGQSSKWTKNSTCRLVARLGERSSGLKVQKAWTAPFKVVDHRSKQYEKHETPNLGSEVWRLKGIHRGGKPHKQLKDEVRTVRDFLFWLSVDPEELKKKLGARDDRWKTMVDHAQTCKIDDKKMYCYKPSTGPQMGVIYDCVGNLKGVIDESHFVPINDKKDRAHKLLSYMLKSSAFVDRYKTFFDDEASLLKQYPYKSSGIEASTSCSIQPGLNGNDYECIRSNQTAEPGSSSQSIFDPHGPSDMVVDPDGYFPTHSVIPCELQSVEVSAADQEYANHPTQHIHSLETNGHDHVDDYPLSYAEFRGLPHFGWVDINEFP